MKRLILALALTLSACSLNTLPQSVVNACTTAGMVWEPVQIAILRTVELPQVHQNYRDVLAAVDRQATGGLTDCLTAVEAGDRDGVKTSIAVVAAATSRAIAVMQGVGR